MRAVKFTAAVAAALTFSSAAGAQDRAVDSPRNVELYRTEIIRVATSVAHLDVGLATGSADDWLKGVNATPDQYRARLALALLVADCLSEVVRPGQPPTAAQLATIHVCEDRSPTSGKLATALAAEHVLQ